MAAASEYDVLLKPCQLIETEDCQKIFHEWCKRGTKFNPTAVILHMRENSFIEQMQGFMLLKDLQTDSCNIKDDLLHKVARHRGKILCAFLLALQREEEIAYWTLKSALQNTVRSYRCKISVDAEMLQPTTRTALKENMHPSERSQLVCPKCDDVMKDPVLLPCLHSCCKECVGVYCCRYFREGRDDKPNLFIRNRIVAAAKRLCLLNEGNSSGSQPSGDEQLHDNTTPLPPLCAVHGCQLTKYCSTCNILCCDTYVADTCGNSHHPYTGIDDIANGVRKWMGAFLEHGLTTDSLDGDAPKSLFNQELITQKCLDVLGKNKQQLHDMSNSAYEDARRDVLMHCQALSKEAEGMFKQLKQAQLYVKSILHDNVSIFDQRELLKKQLQLLLSKAGKASACQYLPGDDELRILPTTMLPECGKRLFIECLQDSYDYMPITRELVGQPHLIEAESSALFWNRNCTVKREKENLSFVAELVSNVKNLTMQLDSAKEELVNAQALALHKNLLDNETFIEKNRAITSSESFQHDGCIELTKNLEKTSHFLCEKITMGELDNVIARLKNQSFIVVRDVNLLKAKKGEIQQAEHLINEVITKKGPDCTEFFLKTLEEQGRKDLVDVVRKGQVPEKDTTEGVRA